MSYTFWCDGFFVSLDIFMVEFCKKSSSYLEQHNQRCCQILMVDDRPWKRLNSLQAPYWAKDLAWVGDEYYTVCFCCWLGIMHKLTCQGIIFGFDVLKTYILFQSVYFWFASWENIAHRVCRGGWLSSCRRHFQNPSPSPVSKVIGAALNFVTRLLFVEECCNNTNVLF